MNTPILFLTFNRPDKTARVFDAIKKAQPKKLYLASDGPRKTKEGEEKLVLETREIISAIDWDCAVYKLYREENLGCKKAVSSAISWFFEHEEMGIVLEDDCLPHETFFPYAESMLHRYKEDESIFHINGSNLLPIEALSSVDTTYYFSKNVHVWGWATWKRAWEKYSLEMEGLDSLETQKTIRAQFADKKISSFWLSLFNHIRKNQTDTWDAQWAFTVLKNNGVCVTPRVNLIENIGFDASATHTKNDDNESVKQSEALSEFSHLVPKDSKNSDHGEPNHTDLNSKIKHPHIEEIHEKNHKYPIRADLDSLVSYRLYIRTFWQKVYNKLKPILKFN